MQSIHYFPLHVHEFIEIMNVSNVFPRFEMETFHILSF